MELSGEVRESSKAVSSSMRLNPKRAGLAGCPFWQKLAAGTVRTLRSLCSAKMGWRGEIELRDAENGHACAKRSHHVSVTSKTRASASPLDRVAALYSRVSRSMACGDGCGPDGVVTLNRGNALGYLRDVGLGVPSDPNCKLF